jgi:hypothetical protein
MDITKDMKESVRAQEVKKNLQFVSGRQVLVRSFFRPQLSVEKVFQFIQNFSRHPVTFAEHFVGNVLAKVSFFKLKRNFGFYNE